MKRYNPFATLTSPSPSLPPTTGQLAHHPNGFFTEEDIHCIKKALQSLERISTQKQTSTTGIESAALPSELCGVYSDNFFIQN